MNQDPPRTSPARTLAPESPVKTNLEIALTSLLTLVCSSTEWEYGESWIPAPTHLALELSSAWSVDTNLDIQRAATWMQFQICSQEFTIGLGEGLPGRVWKSHQLEWIEDVSIESESYFLRHQIAKAFDVKAALAIPIVRQLQLVAVVVFLMSKARAPDPVLIAATQTVMWEFQSQHSIDSTYL